MTKQLDALDTIRINRKLVRGPVRIYRRRLPVEWEKLPISSEAPPMEKDAR